MGCRTIVLTFIASPLIIFWALVNTGMIEAETGTRKEVNTGIMVDYRGTQSSRNYAMPYFELSKKLGLKPRLLRRNVFGVLL